MSSPTDTNVTSVVHQDKVEREEDLTWRSEHPYKKPSGDDAGFTAEWEGSCHCGSIRYQLGRERPLSSKYCHCADCQRMHAAPFQWAAIFHKADLRFLDGARGLDFYSPSLRRPLHDLPCKVYCKTCHTPILDEGRRMVMLFPELLEGVRSQRGKEAFRVGEHICWGRRVVDDGVFEGDGVRKWKGVDKQSELIHDGKGSK